MADEPVDLRFLAEQGRRILEELSEARSERTGMRAEQVRLASALGKVADAVTAIATTQDHHSQILTRHSEILEHHSEILARHFTILEHHSGLLGQINEVQQNNGARLNAIDGRLAIIEARVGLVKA